MAPILYFLGGMLVGAACARYSRNLARIAADNERAAANEREKALISERDAYRAQADSWARTVTDMQMEQANNAGYLDGYHAAQTEQEAEQVAGFSMDVMDNTLRNGGRVSWSVIR